MAVTYEWDIETVHIDTGDIIDHDFSDKLEPLIKRIPFETRWELVLVRNVGNDIEGLTDRHWAYIKDGKLPIWFLDDAGLETTIKVPVRFHKELADNLSLYKQEADKWIEKWDEIYLRRET